MVCSRRSSTSAPGDPTLFGVVVKHDDSGAGDGNTIVALRDADNEPLAAAALRAAIASLPDWYLADLAAGGVVEELVDGDRTSSPSVQFDMFPGGGVRVLATHDQLLGGDNGQVYVGCRFPADPAYASELARYGASVGAELARRGGIGRASADFIAAHDSAGGGDSTASRSICARAAPPTRTRRCAISSLGATTLTPHAG